MKYRSDIIFTYFWLHLYTQKRQFPEAFVATVTKFAKKRKKEQKRKPLVVVETQRLTLHLVV
jgi:hypothetical protein